MDTIRVVLPNPDDCEFTISVTADETPVRGNAMASGDDTFDRDYENEILRRLALGDVWAWALVKVTCSWRGFEGSDTLGCCSYDNQDGFKAGGYWDDMRQQAYTRMIESLVCLSDNHNQ